MRWFWHTNFIAGAQVERQVPVTVEYAGIKFDEGFRADLLVENEVVVELKTVMTYLRP